MKLHHLFENKISNIKTPEQAYEYALTQGKRIPELESIIMKDPQIAQWYAIKVIKERWPEAEPTIMKQAWMAYYYAKDVIKGRWPEAEPYIMKHPFAAKDYAEDIINGRWLEAEPIIMKNPELANAYLRAFPEVRTPSKDVPLVIGKYAVMDVPNTITNEQVVQMCKLVNIIANDIHIKYSRIYFEPTIKQMLEQGKLKKINIRNLEGKQKIGFRNTVVDRLNSDFT